MADENSVPLHVHIETQLEMIERVRKATQEVLEKRLTSMNEFREQLRDQAATMLTRNEFSIAHERMQKDIAELRDFRIGMEAKASMKSVMVVTIISVIGLLVSICGLTITIINLVR